MNTKLKRGARIVAEQWLKVASGEKLCIVTNDEHVNEIAQIKQYAEKAGAYVEVMVFQKRFGQVSHYFDVHETVFDSFHVILGAATHSLVTTKAVKRAMNRGSRFLSLPLSTNDKRSLLEYDFLMMDPEESREMANQLFKWLRNGKEIKVTTPVGSRLNFSMEGREPQLFTGATRMENGYSSSSFEIFIPIIENKTYGIGVVDASLGYLGAPENPVRIYLKDGKICEIEQNEDGQKLSRYIADFQDENMYAASEFGIGLNTCARCEGNSYIEDESAYGTFHIGFGKNIAFGGELEAKGHFDLVFKMPDIYVDGVLIMKQGEIIWDEPEIHVV